MNTSETMVVRPLPRTAAQATVRIALATTAIAAPIATYLTQDGHLRSIAVALWVALAGSLWGTVRLQPVDEPGERLATLLAGGVLANGAAVVAAIGAFI